jgi:subtilisin family serine protease
MPEQRHGSTTKKGESRDAWQYTESGATFFSVNRMTHVPGMIIFRVREDAVRPHLAATGLRFASLDARALPEAVSGPIDFLKQNAGLKRIKPLFSSRQAQLTRSTLSGSDKNRLAVLTSVADSFNSDLMGITVAEVNPKSLTASLLSQLRASPALDIVEPMPARWLMGAVDPKQNLQWGLRAIDWFGAGIPDAGAVKVGVMDTGIDTTHPDLDKSTITYHHDGLSARDLLGHGTHVAGIIAAQVNNGVGISGIAACRLTCWKIFLDEPGDDGEFYVDGERYLQALRTARDAGVHVINLSIGGTTSSQVEELLFRRLSKAGIVIVAAMGNEYQQGNPVEYPAAYPGVMAVGAVSENLKRAVFSNTGKHIAVVAPGTNIVSTLPVKKSPFLPETGYASWSGTSMATPHVSAAAALVLAKNPGQKPDSVRQKLVSSAKKLPGMSNKKWTQEYGAGLINLKTALV